MCSIRGICHPRGHSERAVKKRNSPGKTRRGGNCAFTSHFLSACIAYWISLLFNKCHHLLASSSLCYTLIAPHKRRDHVPQRVSTRAISRTQGCVPTKATNSSAITSNTLPIRIRWCLTASFTVTMFIRYIPCWRRSALSERTVDRLKMLVAVSGFRSSGVWTSMHDLKNAVL